MLCVLGKLLAAGKEDDWIECVSCRNWLHEFCSPYKVKGVDCGRKLLQEKNSNMQTTT
jgi:hypothetical protein